jgi:phenylalanyl-tRNA synthetase beta chain
VIIESAVFDPVSIRRTAQRYSLRSEASARFEKGQESRLARVGADRTARLIAEWGSGRVAVGAVDTAPLDPAPTRVTFRPARVSRLLGVAIEREEIEDLLRRVGIDTEPAQPEDSVRVGSALPPVELDVAGAIDAVVAVVPPHRRDVAIEADVIEEIVRVRGYETVPGRIPDTMMPPYRREPRRFTDELRASSPAAA